MKNTLFEQASLEERQTKLARVIKSKTSLKEPEIIKAVTEISLDNQYSVSVIPPSEFDKIPKRTEKVLSRNNEWEEKVVTTFKVIVREKEGGVAIKKESLIGSLDLSKPETKYILVLC